MYGFDMLFYSKINSLIERNNNCNDDLKVFVRVEEDRLLDISVRFALSDQDSLTKEKEEKIYREIRELSNYHLIPEENDMLKYGILEIKVSYADRDFDSENIVRPLEFITGVMPYLIESDEIE